MNRPGKEARHPLNQLSDALQTRRSKDVLQILQDAEREAPDLHLTEAEAGAICDSEREAVLTVFSSLMHPTL